MPTLHIEHPITDLAVWRRAFDHFADARRRAGVRSERVYQAIDDSHSIVVDLDFETAEEAETFQQFLHTVIWASPENSPALAGTPQTRITHTIAAR